MDEKFKDQINLTNQTPQEPIPYTPQLNSQKKSPIRFLLIIMGIIELSILIALSPIDDLVTIFDFQETIPYLLVRTTISVFASMQIILGLVFILKYSLYHGILKKVSIASLIVTPSFILLTFPLLIFTSIFKVYDELEQTACTLEAQICPDGSAVGRAGPNCEFAPCPTTQNTNEWLVYKNEQVGFLLQYPPSIVKVDDVSDGIAYFYENTEFQPKFTIKIENDQESKTRMDELVRTGTDGKGFLYTDARDIESSGISIMTVREHWDYSIPETSGNEPTPTPRLPPIGGSLYNLIGYGIINGYYFELKFYYDKENEYDKLESDLANFEKIISSISLIESQSNIFKIPELGIQLTLPDDLLDLKYHVEEYENSTAALFTTESLATKFPKCEFPVGGLGWITRVEEPTAIHNKKIGDYFYGIEQAKDSCSRTPGSQEADPLEDSQEELFMTLFDTIEPL